ncbi:MAG: hypothetical protein ACK4YP_26230, partial [Myxococcota bacterium]
LYAHGGTVTVAGTRFAGNTAGDGESGFGGGLAAYGATVTGTDLVFEGNTALLGGGHLYARESVVTCARCTLVSGAAENGGAVYLYDNELTLVGGSVSTNAATETGGGIYARSGSVVTLLSADVEGNTADFGGGLLLSDAHLAATHARVDGNAAASGGGGIYFQASTGSLVNAVVSGNSAGTSNGGGVAVDTSSIQVYASIFAVNSGYSGGALHVGDGALATVANATLTENASGGSAGGIRVTGLGALDLTNSVIAWSSDGAGLSAYAGGLVSTTYDAFWENEGGAVSGDYGDPTGTAGNVTVDPGFVSFADDGAYADDLHLAPASALVDAGDPAVLDEDGTRSDIGAFGGPLGSGWDDRDGDVDGHPVATDCDDDDPAVHPDVAGDPCGGGDQDCDGAVDEDCPD